MSFRTLLMILAAAAFVGTIAVRLSLRHTPTSITRAAAVTATAPPPVPSPATLQPARDTAAAIDSAPVAPRDADTTPSYERFNAARERAADHSGRLH